LIGADKTVRGCGIKGALDEFIAKTLGRLGLHYTLAGDGRRDESALSGALDLLDGVDRGQAGDGCAMFFHFADYVVDNLVVDERPDRIVHQDYVVGCSLKLSQSICNRLLAMLAALNHHDLSSDLLFFQLPAELLHLAFAQGHHDLGDPGVAREDPQGMNNDGDAVNLEELFGSGCFLAGGRHTSAQTGGGDDDDHLHLRSSVRTKSIATLL